jgi:polyribonucleotide nucleotidyltransferase
LLPDADSESNINQQSGGSAKEKVQRKDDLIKMTTTKRPRRKKQFEPSGAENATTKTLEKSAAAPVNSKGNETTK